MILSILGESAQQYEPPGLAGQLGFLIFGHSKSPFERGKSSKPKNFLSFLESESSKQADPVVVEFSRILTFLTDLCRPGRLLGSGRERCLENPRDFEKFWKISRHLEDFFWNFSINLQEFRGILRILELPRPISDVFLIDFQ